MVMVLTLSLLALTLSLPATTSLHLFGWSPPQPQRGHRVRPEYCEDLPASWACQAKLAQLAGRIPTEHDLPSEHDLPTEHDLPSEHDERARVATFAMGCYWGAELAFQREPGVLATCVGHTGYESGGCDARSATRALRATECSIPLGTWARRSATATPRSWARAAFVLRRTTRARGK